jgi:hypothetical protein
MAALPANKGPSAGRYAGDAVSDVLEKCCEGHIGGGQM